MSIIPDFYPLVCSVLYYYVSLGHTCSSGSPNLLLKSMNETLGDRPLNESWTPPGATIQQFWNLLIWDAEEHYVQYCQRPTARQNSLQQGAGVYASLV